jgi:hypothetical protein
LETYDNNVHPPSRIAKKVRVAATSIMNINVSAANLETFIGTMLSWRKQLELDQKAVKLIEVQMFFLFDVFVVSRVDHILMHNHMLSRWY